MRRAAPFTHRKDPPMPSPLLRRALRPLPMLAALLLAGTAWSQTTVTEAWVRGTVAQQKTTGAFLKISSARGGRLVSVSSAAAGAVEIHEMAMDGTTMRMRPLPQGLPLPAGKTVSLAPGGLHLMMTDLKSALKAGDTVELSLLLEGPDGVRETLRVKAPVRPLGGSATGDHRH